MDVSEIVREVITVAEGVKSMLPAWLLEIPRQIEQFRASLPTELVQLIWYSCIVVSGLILLVQLLNWRAARSALFTFQALCLSVLVHLCLWMGCTVWSDNEAKLRAAHATEEVVAIREVIVEQEAPPDIPVSDTRSRPVWERHYQFTDVAREFRQRSAATPQPDITEQPVPERESVTGNIPTVAPPTMSNQSDLVLTEHAPDALPSVETKPQPTAVAAVDGLEEPVAPAAEARPEFQAATQVRERTAAAQTSAVTPSDAVADSEAVVERTPSRDREPVVGFNPLRMTLSRQAPIAGVDRQGNLGQTLDEELQGPIRSRTTEIATAAPVAPRMAASPEEVVSLLTGVVTDADTGRPLGGATVRIDRVDEAPLTAMTQNNGLYRLSMTELPDHVAITVVREGYLPESRNLGSKMVRLDFALHPVNESLIAVERDPQVHHLGNDVFSGNENSQFQRESEGRRWNASFTITADQIRFQPNSATLTMITKGMQFEAPIRINGVQLMKPYALSPKDGSFGPVSIPFPPHLLKRGANQITVDTVERNGDVDDFEFVNLTIRLNRR